MKKIPSIGDTIKFGPYEWLVLAKKGPDMLLLTKNVIANRPYHDKFEAVTWETSALRAWLNGPFLEDFSETQRRAMRPTELVNLKNPDYPGTNGGEKTVDTVFLLSVGEVKTKQEKEKEKPKEKEKSKEKDKSKDETREESYIAAVKDRMAEPTERAVKEGIWVGQDGNSDWWLRTPGQTNNDAAKVFHCGYINLVGYYVGGDDPKLSYGTGIRVPNASGVRPAVWVEAGRWARMKN